MRRFLPGLLLALLPSLLLAAAAPKAASDLLPPLRRQAVVEMAEQLTRPPVPAPLPEAIKLPFSPAEFADDVRSGARTPLAAAANGGAAPAPGAAPGPSGAAGGAVAGPSDREILEMLAPRIPSRGTLVFGGKRMLLVDKSRFEVGTQFTVGYNGNNYDLELVAIDSTSFTLRYRGEELTRPILLKSGTK